jgi:hypothetical protein
VFRDVRRFVTVPGSTATFWVASEITVDGVPVDRWIAVDGVTEGGEVNMEFPPPFGDAPWVERRWGLLGYGNLEIRVVCKEVFVAAAE